MIWHRQSPARLVGRAMRLMSAWTVLLGSAAAALLLTGGSLTAAKAVYPAAAALLIPAAAAVWSRDMWAENGSLARKTGILRLEEHSVGREQLTALELDRTPLLTLFGALPVRAYTSGDIISRERRRLLLRRDDALRLADRLMPAGCGHIREFHARARSAVITALSSADFLSGLLTVIPLVSWFAKHVDPALPDRLIFALGQAGRAIFPDVSPVLSALALIPAAGWVLHFITTVLAYNNFQMIRSGGTLTVRRGTLISRTVRFPMSAVSAIESRQTVLTCLLGLSRTSALVAGYGRCVLLPASDRHESGVEISTAFPHGEPGLCIYSAGAIYWCRWRLLCVFGTVLLTLRIAAEAGEWRGAVLLAGLPAAAIIMKYALASALAGRNASVRLFGDCVEISGMQDGGAVKLRVMRGSIAQAKIVQHPFQRAAGRCSLYILPRGIKRGIWCRHLSYRQCMSLIGRLG